MEIVNQPGTETEQSNSRLERITIADGLFVLIVIIGGLFRFVDLGKIPLAATEAELAWAVWRFWQPGAELLPVTSPAYFTFTSALTQVFGFSDTAVRLVPALFGLGVVCLPWLLRRQIGTIAALVVSIFLAISPLNVIISRTVGGEAIAVFAIGLVAVSILRIRVTAVGNWFYLLALALGLGLSSAPLFYSGLLALLITWAVLRLFSIKLSQNEPVSMDKSTTRNGIIIGAATFALCSSFLLWYPAGFGASAQIFGDWIAQFQGENGRAFAEPFMAVVRYEPGLVVLGLVAIIWAIWQNNATALAALYWFSGVLVLMLAQSGVMSNAALLTIPGYFLVGMMVQFVLSRKSSYPLMAGGIAIGLFAILMLIFVNLARYLRVIVFDPRDIQFVLVISLSIVLAGTILYLLATVDATAVAQGTLLSFMAVLLFFTWGTSWWLSHEAANDPRERWVLNGTDDDVRLLVSNLHAFSRLYTNSADEIDIASSVNTPTLRWYLRDFSNAQFGETLPATTNNRLLITPSDSDQALGNAYSGSDFRLQRMELSPPVLPNTLEDVINLSRWWLFHDSHADVPTEHIILWVRGDLSQP